MSAPAPGLFGPVQRLGSLDPWPPLGSGYERIAPVRPHRPVMPAGAPGELRLDATEADVIPGYPY